MTALINFGKYKDVPADAIHKIDPGYVEWALNQSWLPRLHPNVYNIFVSNAQPSDTPIHNALQAKFLDPEYRAAFCETVHPGLLERPSLVFEGVLEGLVDAARSRLMECGASTEQLAQAYRDLHIAEKHLEELPKKCWPHMSSSVKFEHNRADVWFRMKAEICFPSNIKVEDLPKPLHCLRAEADFALEIKPTVGDDYPAILRQMNHTKAKYLFLEEYTGIGVTVDQFRDMFAESDKIVVFRGEVDAQYRDLMAQPIHDFGSNDDMMAILD